MKQIWIIIVCLWIITVGVMRVTWKVIHEGCHWIDKKIDELFEGLL